MDAKTAAETLRRIIRRELAECERSMRDRDPVRGLNDLADAARELRALAEALDREAGANDA